MGFVREPAWFKGEPDEYELSVEVGELDNEHAEALAQLMRLLGEADNVIVNCLHGVVRLRLMGWIPDHQP